MDTNLAVFMSNTYSNSYYSQGSDYFDLKPKLKSPDYFVGGEGLLDGLIVSDSATGMVNLVQGKKKCVVEKLLKVSKPAGMLLMADSGMLYLIDQSTDGLSSLNQYSYCDGSFKLVKRLFKNIKGDLVSFGAEEEQDGKKVFNYFNLDEWTGLTEPDKKLDTTWQPKDITLSKHGHLVISDVSPSAGNRLGCYDLTGKMISHYGRAEGPGVHTFESPLYLCNDIFGRIIASDTKVGKVEVYDSRGFWINTINCKNEKFEKKNFEPCGVTSDHYGNILVCDAVQSRIALFSHSGEFVENIILNKKSSKKNFTKNLLIDYSNKKLIVSLCDKKSNKFEKLFYKSLE